MTDISAEPAFTRALSLFESFSALSAMTIWYTAHVQGPLDMDKLNQAWAALRGAHPALTGRLVPGEAEAMPGMPGLDLVVPAEPGEARVRVREAVDGEAPDTYSVNHDEAVAFVDVVPLPDQTLVSFAVHHSLADGRLAGHWNHQLWSLYTDLVEGRTPAIEPRPVPKAPETLLAERGVEKTELGPSRMSKAVVVELPETGADPTALRKERVRLSAEATARLHSYAKAQGLTLHGPVAGAIAAAARRALPVAEDLVVDLAVNSPVDIRGRVDPPIPVWGGTNVLGSATAVVAVRADSDPFEVGAEVAAQLREDLEAGSVHQSFLHMADDFGKAQPKVPSVGTTNVGVLERLPAPEGIVVTDLHGWVHADWSPVMALMAAAGEQNPKGPMLGMHIITTYEGRLSVDIGTSAPPKEARAYAETVESLLLEIASGRADRQHPVAWGHDRTLGD